METKDRWKGINNRLQAALSRWEQLQAESDRINRRYNAVMQQNNSLYLPTKTRQAKQRGKCLIIQMPVNTNNN